MRKCQPFFKCPVVVVCISTNPTKCSPVIGVNVATQEARVSVSLWCPEGRREYNVHFSRVVQDVWSRTLMFFNIWSISDLGRLCFCLPAGDETLISLIPEFQILWAKFLISLISFPVNNTRMSRPKISDFDILSQNKLDVNQAQ